MIAYLEANAICKQAFHSDFLFSKEQQLLRKLPETINSMLVLKVKHMTAD